MAKMGRPRKFSSVEELQNEIDKFFEITPEEEQTITGLALHLETYRKVLMEYETGKYDEHFNDKIDFSNTIKRAKDRIANGYEKRCIKRGNAGDIFALKNFGWKDKQEVDMKHSGEVGLGDVFKDVNK